MRVPVLIYRIDTGFAETWYTAAGPEDWTIGRYVHIIIDDATDVITIELRSSTDPDDSGALIGGGPIISGPDLYFNASVGTFITGYGGVATIITQKPYYQRCDVHTLVKFAPIGPFPYGQLTYIPGAAECAVLPTCDLELSSVYTSVRASSDVATDAEIHVTASGSNGTIKYSLTQNFDYTTEGQLTGDFTGLSSAIYTVYVRDQIGCQDSIIIDLRYKLPYGVKYRLEFNDVMEGSGLHHRIDIEERGFEGDLEEICGGGTPFTVRYNGDANDPSKVIIPAEVTFSLKSETPGKFAELFGPDDRKFRIVHYVNHDTQPFFIGFNISEFYEEPYIHEPFDVEITATCGLKELDNYPFVDENGNKFKGDLRVIEILSNILKLTGLELSIRSGINIFDTNMIKNGLEDLLFFSNFSEPGWANRGSGTPWSVVSGSQIEVVLTTGQSQEYFFTLPATSQPGAYSYFINRTISGIGGGDSLNLIYTFYDALGSPIAAVSNTEFISANSTFNFPHGGTAPARAAVVGIIAQVNSGSGITARIIDFPLTGPALTSSQDVLDQLYVDSRIFLDDKNQPTNCGEVVRIFLDTFRGSLFQSQGYWWIVRNSDRCTSFPYRQFDFRGNIESDGTIDSLLELKVPRETNRLAWVFPGQKLSFMRNYGKFTITQDLGKDGNLIDEGRFEEDDLVDLGSGNTMFKNWNFTIGQPGVKYGFQAVDNKGSLGAFFTDFSAALGDQVDSQLFSKEIPFSGGAPDQIKVSFQYLIIPTRKVEWLRLGWQLKITNSVTTIYFINDINTPGFNRWTTTPFINDLYCNTFGEFQSFDVTAKASNDGTSIGDGTIQISFFMHNHAGRDYEDITELKTFNPSTYPEPSGLQRLVGDDSDPGGAKELTRFYRMEWSNAAEDIPNIVHPNSWAPVFSYDYLWKLDKTYDVAALLGLVQQFLIDNVSIAYFPWTSQGVNIDPPATIDYTDTVDERVKSVLEKTIFLGDLYDMPNAVNLYRGYFRLSDGTPTSSWARVGVSEDKLLVGEMLMEDYRTQFSDPQRSLSGSMVSDGVIFHFINSVRDNVDMNRYYPMVWEWDVKAAKFTVNMVRLITSDDGGPVSEGSFSSGFSDGFKIGS